MQAPSPHNTKNFIHFLKEQTITQQQDFIKNNPSQKILLERKAQEYLNSPQTKKDSLKLKAWLLLPKKESKMIPLKSILVDQSIVNELLKGVIEAGQFWRLKQLKECGIRIKPEEVDSLLREACREGDLKKAKLLLKINAKVNGPNEDGFTPLHLAFRAGHLELGEFLIHNGADLMLKDNKQKTPLHHLCESGKNEEALEIFQKQISHQLLPLEGITIASSLGLTFIAKKLIDQLNDLDQQVDEKSRSLKPGDSLVHCLIKSESPNLDVLRYLKEKGADFEKVNAQGRPPLQQALSMSLNLKIIDCLIDLGTKNINYRPPNGYTLLEWAIVENNLALTRLFLDKGASINTRDSDDDTPLHIAAASTETPNIEIIELLTSHGADLDAINSFGESCAWLIKIMFPQHSIPFNPQTTDALHEFELRTLLANNFNLPVQTSMNNKIFGLSSGKDIFGKTKVVEIVKKFKNRSPIDLEEACKSIEKGSKKADGKPEKIAKQYQKGQTLIFTAGWLDHAVQVIFIDDYMLITNRGDGRKKNSIQVYKIDRTRPLSLEDILKLKVNFESQEKGVKFLYEDLPARLGYQADQPDLIAKIMMEKCQQSTQKMKNCWWLSHKSGVLGLITLQALLKEASKPHESEKIKEAAYEQIVDSTKEIYKYFSEFTLVQLIKEYVERPPDLAERDHALIKLVVDKYRAKNHKHIVDYKGYIRQTYDFFANLLATETQKKLPPLYTKEEVEGWIDNYKHNFQLNDNFESLNDSDYHLMYLGG